MSKGKYISIRGTSYDKLRDYAKSVGGTMAEIVDALCLKFLKRSNTPTPRVGGTVAKPEQPNAMPGARAEDTGEIRIRLSKEQEAKKIRF
jgi:hypothetical protein